MPVLGPNIALGAHARRKGGGVFAGWSYRREVTVDNTGGAAKTSHAVKLVLTDANFDFAKADADGADFRAGSETSAYQYWIETWDADAETATVWVKVPSIPADGSATFFVYYGKAAVLSRSNIYSTFIFGDDFSNIDRFRGLPGLAYASRNNSASVVLGNAAPSIIVAEAATWKNTVREQSNIIYDPEDSDPDRRYKVYFTGFDGNRRIGVAFSPDGYAWTEYGSNPIISEGEDPYIMRNVDGSLYRDLDGKMHMYTEDQLQQDMLHYTSVDGVAWTADPANPVIVRSEAAYDDHLVGSPIALHISGHNKYVMIYEGMNDSGANDWTCLARASTPDGANWVKEPTNPISILGVPDELVLTDAGWVYLGHLTSGPPERWLAKEIDTDLWDDTSFSPYGPNPMTTLIPSSGYNVGSASDGVFGQRVITQTSARTSLEMFDVLGSNVWRIERLANALSGVTAYDVLIDVANPRDLVMTPVNGGGVTAIVAYTTGLDLTSNFALMFRRKQAENTSGDQLAHVGIGSGVVLGQGASPHFPTFSNGYQFATLDPGATGSLALRKYVDGAIFPTDAALIAAVISQAEANNFAVHEVRYLADGSMAYLINGTSKWGAISDTAHLAAEKNIMLAQGNTNARPGAISTYEWVAVRPFDGVDPTQTVGSEETL